MKLSTLFYAFITVAVTIILVIAIYFIVKNPCGKKCQNRLEYKIGPNTHIIPPTLKLDQGIRLIREEAMTELYETFKTLTEFLDKHRIQYWIVHGTLLGQQRHQGFIPWDDDVDIAMFKNDIDRLISLKKPLKECCNLVLYNQFDTLRVAKSGFPKYPFVDIFEYRRDGDLLRPRPKEEKMFPREVHQYRDVFPLKQVKFEGFQVWAPKNSVKILKEQYSPTVYEEAKKPDHGCYGHFLGSFMEPLMSLFTWKKQP